MSGEIFLDHVGWMVPDMVKAASVFDALGFTLTPLSIHHDKNPETGEAVLVGSSNRLAMLSFGYLGSPDTSGWRRYAGEPTHAGCNGSEYWCAPVGLLGGGCGIVCYPGWKSADFPSARLFISGAWVESQGGNQVEAAFHRRARRTRFDSRRASASSHSFDARACLAIPVDAKRKCNLWPERGNTCRRRPSREC